MNNLDSYCDPCRRVIWPDQKEGTFQRASDQASDDVIAADLHSLTYQERQAITDEIHGVGNNVIEETVERVQEALKSLREDYLSNHSNTCIPNANKTPLNVATQNQRIVSAKRDTYDRAVF